MMEPHLVLQVHGPAAAASASAAPLWAHQTHYDEAPGSSSSKKRARKLSNSERGKLYRSRRKQFEGRLERDVSALRREVGELQLAVEAQRRRSPCDAPVLSSELVGRVVAEYFRMFEFGIPPIVNAQQAAAAPLALESTHARFLLGVMHPELALCGAPRGVLALLEQWTRYSAYHAAIKYEVESVRLMAPDPLPVVHISARLRVRFSRATIDKVFPGVAGNAALEHRLLGREVAYPVGNTFYFGDDGRIHRYDTHVDFVAAFVDALGSVRDSLLLLEHAHIRSEAMIGDAADESMSMREEVHPGATTWSEKELGSDAEDEQRRRQEMDHTRAAMSLRAIL